MGEQNDIIIFRDACISPLSGYKTRENFYKNEEEHTSITAGNIICMIRSGLISRQN